VTPGFALNHFLSRKISRLGRGHDHFPASVLLLFLLTLAFLFPACALVGLPTVNEEALCHFREALEKSGLKDAGPYMGPQSIPGTEALEEALAAATKAIDLAPRFYQAHLARAQILEFLKKSEECLEALIYLMELAPDLDPVREEVAMKTADVKGDYDEAVRIVREGIARNPLNPGFHLLEVDFFLRSPGGCPSGKVLDTLEKVLRFRLLSMSHYIQISALCVKAAEPSQPERQTRILIEAAAKCPDSLPYAILDAAGNQWTRSSPATESPGSTESTGSTESIAYLTGLLSLLEKHPEADFELKFTVAKLYLALEQSERAIALIRLLDEEAEPDSIEKHALAVLEGHHEFMENRPQEALRLFLAELDKRPASQEALQGLLLIFQSNPQLVGQDQVCDRIRKALEQPDLGYPYKKELTALLELLGKAKPGGGPTPPPSP